jgi:hypothetical protein
MALVLSATAFGIPGKAAGRPVAPP